MNTSTISIAGLNKEKAGQLAGELNKLLANYQVFYQNVRGFHWNIRGEKFFELHVKFEELYDDLLLKIDEIAERIVTLGAVPVHTWSDYLNLSSIGEAKDITRGEEGAGKILESLLVLLDMQRKILDLSADAGDEGTNALMSDYIREQEKLAWMYDAFLHNE
ncbi:MAG: DNA starvation/stationary phase protection protein [Chlorobi bacterium]|nr:DNA starvation/stationary phase protection protein [Chlorobiota bacterium]